VAFDPPPAPSPALDFLRHLWRLNHTIEQVSKQMEARLGLTSQQRLMLRWLGRYPGITSSTLSAQLHLDRATVSVSLARLEKKGLVARERSLLDHRVVHLSLSRKGARLDTPASGTLESAVEAMLQHVPPASVAATRNVLESLHQLLRDQLDSAPARPQAVKRSKTK
jgi:DNA-binding MarR family transcriptional regulator